MNNLRVCNGLDGSIPTAPTIDSVALTLPGRVKRVEKAAFCSQVPGPQRGKSLRSERVLARFWLYGEQQYFRARRRGRHLAEQTIFGRIALQLV